MLDLLNWLYCTNFASDLTNKILNIMTQEEKNRLTEFCFKHMHTHTDWTGTRVETVYYCEDVKDFIDSMVRYIENGIH